MLRSIPIGQKAVTALVAGIAISCGANLAFGQKKLTPPLLVVDESALPPVLNLPPTPKPPAPQLAPAETATPVVPAAPVVPEKKKAAPPAPAAAPAPPVSPAPVKPVETLPAPPPAVVKPVPPKVEAPPKSAAPPVTALTENGSWKILIRPEVYKAADPWEYVRTGQVTWGNPPLSAAPAKPSSTAAAVGDAVPPMPAGPYAPLAVYSGTPCGPTGYLAAYNAIPFSRAEYEANPSYRHDSAMELLFGTMRPTTVVKQNQPYFSRYPDLFRYRHSVYPYPTPGSHTVDLNYSWNYNGYW